MAKFQRFSTTVANARGFEKIFLKLMYSGDDCFKFCPDSE